MNTKGLTILTPNFSHFVKQLAVSVHRSAKANRPLPSLMADSILASSIEPKIRRYNLLNLGVLRALCGASRFKHAQKNASTEMPMTPTEKEPITLRWVAAWHRYAMPLGFSFPRNRLSVLFKVGRLSYTAEAFYKFIITRRPLVHKTSP